ncbi:HipB Predicted transcriptional regulators [uncultured Caudovirales phage]|uniref:HipB Predicted transcriptional regulators n=1 Tax=uncultured Caudovirales phage TaxID=2100421 RepID=A0A6J5M1P5_9CAUD|nr:HipB Predicted transcriptional regulators [uncultured Caudovirales phage]
MLQISQNIRWLRLLSGLRQDDFAKKIGCKSGALRTYENGRTVPNELIQQKLCELYGITQHELNNADLKKKEIHVINPDTKSVEFTLTNTTQTNGKEQELSVRVIELETEVKLLKELIEKLIEKR